MVLLLVLAVVHPISNPLIKSREMLNITERFIVRIILKYMRHQYLKKINHGYWVVEV